MCISTEIGGDQQLVFTTQVKSIAYFEDRFSS